MPPAQANHRCSELSAAQLHFIAIEVQEALPPRAWRRPPTSLSSSVVKADAHLYSHAEARESTAIGEIPSVSLEAASGFEPLYKGFADPRLNHLATPPLWCRGGDLNSHELRSPPPQDGVSTRFHHLGGCTRCLRQGRQNSNPKQSVSGLENEDTTP